MITITERGDNRGFTWHFTFRNGERQIQKLFRKKTCQVSQWQLKEGGKVIPSHQNCGPTKTGNQRGRSSLRQDKCRCVWEICVDITTRKTESHNNLQLGAAKNYFELKVNHFPLGNTEFFCNFPFKVETEILKKRNPPLK